MKHEAVWTVNEAANLAELECTVCGAHACKTVPWAGLLEIDLDDDHD